MAIQRNWYHFLKRNSLKDDNLLFESPFFLPIPWPLPWTTGKGNQN